MDHARQTTTGLLETSGFDDIRSRVISKCHVVYCRTRTPLSTEVKKETQEVEKKGEEEKKEEEKEEEKEKE